MFGVTRRFGFAIATNYRAFRGLNVCRAMSSSGNGQLEITVPDYQANPNETTGTKRARLLYQSRKRGMLENDLLLSTFVDKYLAEMDPELLAEYDSLINCPYSDWDIYYWAVGSRPTPPEFENKVMALLREHVQNKSRERRLRQPDLPKEVYSK